MKNGKKPDPNVIHPVAGYDKEIYVKPTITNPNIIVGDFTYIADSEFESHVTNFYPWSRDKLIIGKFCQIAAGVEFVMNDANHQMNAVSTFPFYTLEGWEMNTPDPSEMPFKGDTVIGNDVWIGQNAVVLPGIHIGDGAIIGANSIVGSDVDPYTIVVGNPAKPLRKRKSRQDYDHTDYGCISYWKNASGSEDARKIQISISVDRSPENGPDPQWQYGIDTGRRRVSDRISVANCTRDHENRD